MIRQFRLENFKGHRDTDLALERFTVLVGDNGSGKTSVLEALQLPGKLGTHPDDLALDELLRRGANHIRLSSDGSTHGQRWTSSLEITAPGHSPWGDAWVLKAGGVDHSGQFGGASPLNAAGGYNEALRKITSLTGRVGLYRFRSDQIAASAYSDQPDASVAQDGAQTAVALAALKLADDEAFNRIETAMRRVVPALKRVFIKPATLKHPSNPNPVTGSKLYFDFQGAKDVPAHHASQGTLVALALLTVLHGRDRPSVILLDDFDHSLHPRAQMELVRMIKELLELDELNETQIIATTHSPYVLDEVAPSNVIAFALRDDGTVSSKPLSEHPDAHKMTGALKSGELWSLDGERDWVL
jgi:energy-coupling factor transporter ATP-binding protein EcfA2